MMVESLAKSSVHLNSFLDIFLTAKAIDTIQTALEDIWNKKNYYSKIEFKFVYGWKSDAAFE